MIATKLEVGQVFFDDRGNEFVVEPFHRMISLKEPAKTEKFKKLLKEQGNFVKNQLQKGIKVEMEHSKDPLIAESIARDHLLESPYYYVALEAMEKELGIE